MGIFISGRTVFIAKCGKWICRGRNVRGRIFLPTEAHYTRMFGRAKRSGDLGLDVISPREARQELQRYKEYVRRTKDGKNSSAIGKDLKAWLRKGGPDISLNPRVSGRVCQARAGPPPPLCSALPGGRARGGGGGSPNLIKFSGLHPAKTRDKH